MALSIAYISDLHLEFYTPTNAYEAVVRPLLASLKPNVDLVVFAGDIFVYGTPSEGVFYAMRDTLMSKGYRVLHVNGNHEFYQAENVDVYNRLSIVQNITVGDVTIVTGTYPPHSTHIQPIVGDLVNDYYQCLKTYYRTGVDANVWSPEDAFRLLQDKYDKAHEIFVEVANKAKGKVLFVTHFRPWFEPLHPEDSLAFEYPRNKADLMFPFYNVLPHKEISVVPVGWIHGHSHDHYYILGKDGTTYLNNCLGYPDQFIGGPNWEYFVC